jgi:hypothetical protein
MVTKYIPRKPKPRLPKTVKVILKKDYPLGKQIDEVATILKKACPDIFKKKEPYPTVRMEKFKGGDIVYEITQGTSKAKTGPA